MDPNPTGQSLSIQRGPWTRKPLSIVLQETSLENSSGTRHLGLLDLISIGVGGTIGSGIFVLTGLIAHHYAGPATFVSFLISGLAASCSGLCYAEWAARMPAAGSAYVYALVSLGEWAAVVAGACLTLEYAVSGAAVARSWGDKLVEYLTEEWHWESASSYLGSDYFNPLAGVISTVSVAILACGVQESKAVTNFFTVLKIGLVVFMIIGGLCLFKSENMTPFSPFGFTGILRGATSSFFGYLGYDEVCCLASEAKNPADMPRAVLWTLAFVTVLYILASFALVGMVPTEQISDTSGFPAAFSSRGIAWAAQLTAAGEVVTLPVVVLISLLAQPRLFAAMAQDGLLPEIFSRRDSSGNLFSSILLCGIPMALLATFVPFSYLDDCISVGILIAFNMTNSSLILMKCESPVQLRPTWLPRNLVLFHVLAFTTGLSSHIVNSSWVPVILVAISVLYAFRIHTGSARQKIFGGSLLKRHDSNVGDWDALEDAPETFETPLMPLLPLFGISMNWYLIAQLEWKGLVMLVVYIVVVSTLYIFLASKNPPWTQPYARLRSDDEPVLLREFSLPTMHD